MLRCVWLVTAAVPAAAGTEADHPYGLAVWWEEESWPLIGASGGLGFYSTDPSSDFGISGDATVVSFDVTHGGVG